MKQRVDDRLGLRHKVLRISGKVVIILMITQSYLGAWNPFSSDSWSSVGSAISGAFSDAQTKIDNAFGKQTAAQQAAAQAQQQQNAAAAAQLAAAFQKQQEETARIIEEVRRQVQAAAEKAIRDAAMLARKAPAPLVLPAEFKPVFGSNVIEAAVGSKDEVMETWCLMNGVPYQYQVDTIDNPWEEHLAFDQDDRPIPVFKAIAIGSDGSLYAVSAADNAVYKYHWLKDEVSHEGTAAAVTEQPTPRINGMKITRSQAHKVAKKATQSKKPVTRPARHK